MNCCRGVGLIGYGAIGREVADALVTGAAGELALRAVLCRRLAGYRIADRRALDAKGVLLTDDADAFFSRSPELVVEVAGQDALRSFGGRALASGCDLLVTSIGAFTDDEFFADLQRLAQRHGRRIALASGALPAVDWMSAAALAGGARVEIVQEKPCRAWRDTPAADLVDLDALAEAHCFFHGSAREAARRFPKSSNITALLALATVGLDGVAVRLVADPHGTRMRTRIDFQSDAGALELEWHGVPSTGNPSTSADVPLAVIKALRNLSATVAYGV